MGTLISIAICIADIWAIIETIRSAEPPGKKALWVLVILILPILGLLIWLFLGPKPVKT